MVASHSIVMRFSIITLVKTLLIIILIFNIYVFYAIFVIGFQTHRQGNEGSDFSGIDGNGDKSDVRTALAWSLAPKLNKSTPAFGTDSRAILHIRKMISQVNGELRVQNSDKISISTFDIVLLVQVHDRVNYFKHLIDSIRNIRHVERVLLIVSMDSYQPGILQAIASVDFCLVMKIFYPFMMELFPSSFPGKDPRDCPRDIRKDAAIRTGCLNAEWPDKYGHYREVNYVQTKHHWWWKLNFAFSMPVLSRFRGPLVLLEEDHYLAPDFVHVLDLLEKNKRSLCADCKLHVLGSYPKDVQFGLQASRVQRVQWVSSKHNMGMVVGRELWQQLTACAHLFCTYDDYNWDWTLMHLSFACIPGHLPALLLATPRVFHIGECGVHHRGASCDPSGRVATIERWLDQNRDALFPAALQFSAGGWARLMDPKPNGGWGDRRDQQLCLNGYSEVPDLR